jgi:hypothetical protein
MHLCASKELNTGYLKGISVTSWMEMPDAVCASTIPFVPLFRVVVISSATTAFEGKSLITNNDVLLT